jgi:hypothetical protein
MQNYFSLLKHKLPTLTGSFRNHKTLIHNTKIFFSDSKQTQYTKHPSESNSEININLNEDTIEAEPIESTTEKEFKITDMYTIKSKKLGDPNIKKIIDSTKFQHNNVKLRAYNKEDYNKDSFKNSTLIPVSPKLGPFEVR